MRKKLLVLITLMTILSLLLVACKKDEGDESAATEEVITYVEDGNWKLPTSGAFRIWKGEEATITVCVDGGDTYEISLKDGVFDFPNGCGQSDWSGFPSKTFIACGESVFGLELVSDGSHLLTTGRVDALKDRKRTPRSVTVEK